MLKVISTDKPIEEFMKTEAFENEIAGPAKQYHAEVYRKATDGLTPVQKQLFDIWWNGGLYPWKYQELKAPPIGYEWCTYEDLKAAYESIMEAVSLGCG